MPTTDELRLVSTWAGPNSRVCAICSDARSDRSARDPDRDRLNCERLFGERTCTSHRADLLDAVRAAVPPEHVRLGTRCTAVDATPDGAVHTFADADLVIGADGVHSVVRGAVAAPPPRLLRDVRLSRDRARRPLSANAWIYSYDASSP